VSREPDDINAALAALADGTLPDDRHESVSARVSESPELAAELEDQRRAVLLVRSLERVEAPDLLRRSIELAADGELATAAAGRTSDANADTRRRRAFPFGAKPAAALALGAAVAVVLVLVLTSGGATSSPPTVLQASHTALLAATGGAPAESRDNNHQLTISAAGIAYPYWGGSLGWNATGARTDTVDGRTVTTVFYASRHGRRIGYSIVSGPALAIPSGSASVQRHGLSFHVVSRANPTIVTWREAGHTCILTAHGVSAHTLVHLAAWARA
jgi:anti-sigma factor RsiW